MTKYRNKDNTAEYEVTINYHGLPQFRNKLMKKYPGIHYYNSESKKYNKLTTKEEQILINELNNCALTTKIKFIDQLVKTNSNKINYHYDYQEHKQFALEFPQSHHQYLLDLFNTKIDLKKVTILQIDLVDLFNALNSELSIQAETATYASGTQIVWVEVNKIDYYLNALYSKDHNPNYTPHHRYERKLDHDFYGSYNFELCKNLLHGNILTIKQTKGTNKMKTVQQLFSEPTSFGYNDYSKSDTNDYFNLDHFLETECQLTMIPTVKAIKLPKLNKKEQK